MGHVECQYSEVEGGSPAHDWMVSRMDGAAAPRLATPAAMSGLFGGRWME